MFASDFRQQYSQPPHVATADALLRVDRLSMYRNQRNQIVIREKSYVALGNRRLRSDLAKERQNVTIRGRADGERVRWRRQWGDVVFWWP
jgi:hypothetical protein